MMLCQVHNFMLQYLHKADAKTLVLYRVALEFRNSQYLNFFNFQQQTAIAPNYTEACSIALIAIQISPREVISTRCSVKYYFLI